MYVCMYVYICVYYIYIYAYTRIYVYFLLVSKRTGTHLLNPPNEGGALP